MDCKDEQEIKEAATELLKDIEQDQGKAALLLLKTFNRQSRAVLVNQVINTWSLLFASIALGHTDLLDYILEECDVDVEKSVSMSMIIYGVKEDRFVTDARLLWAAAVYNQVNIVECLLQHGADIDARSNVLKSKPLGPTAVDAACFCWKIEALGALLKAGASIPYQSKLFMKTAIKSLDVLAVLVDNGFDVDSKNKQGNTLLHLAIDGNLYNAAQFLLERGADINVKSIQGENALQAACILRNTTVVELILKKRNLGPAGRIEAYELLGLSIIEHWLGVDKALIYWTEAAKTREENPSVTTVYLPPHRAFHLTSEPKNHTELIDLVLRSNGCFDYAMILRERLLGQFSSWTGTSLQEILEQVNDLSELVNYINLALYICVRGKPGSTDAPNTNKAVYDLCDGMWMRGNRTKEQFTKRLLEYLVFIVSAQKQLTLEQIKQADSLHWWFDASIDILARITDQLELLAVKKSEKKGGKKKLVVGKSKLALITSHFTNSGYLVVFINRLSKLDPERDLQFRKFVRRLLLAQSAHLNPVSLLVDIVSQDCHQLCYIQQPGHETESFSPWKHTTQLLIECGADVTNKDSLSNTALHICADYLTGSLCEDMPERLCTHPDSGSWYEALDQVSKLHDIRSLIKLLLDHDVHPDTVNHLGVVAIDVIRRYFPGDFPTLNHVALQCLAARVIRQRDIPFTSSDIPKHLLDFVSMH